MFQVLEYGQLLENSRLLKFTSNAGLRNFRLRQFEQVDPTGEPRFPRLGPNGSGKTTMMDVITGKTRPESGNAWFARQIECSNCRRPEIAQAGIGRKFQKPTVFEQLTIFENLELALAGRKSFVQTLLARMTVGDTRGSKKSSKSLVSPISGKCQDESCLTVRSNARNRHVLMQEPQLLMLDEPVAGMIPYEIERTAQLLLSLAGTHSVVVVEHDMDFVRSIAKRVTVLHEGRVLAEGDME